ncbi:MAG: hypothetical protein A2268_04970 [Candidatus Raymondbacteria bacterium RifOxyA12_full_50_37]|uniref:Histidine kinase/HSP90-like ATPase domain-containing protein n=1 Tax=Candidatus Raymondbacteria bacterium RIFOXYD12_FULL_49_13 TaxID=1817890 RepID=A0A1F7FDW0_UNCRA|nr:MAG: hypothetical protein A2268_04970 [Candidatus Raymondbacteria bacterium RifOxyA12_full_50_37]OGJ94095.1 MAG: hypothetical protein A2248_12175 [Candidatus Raymondbacteria bacterium RIFOXYA2_FULL_49_16]OGJ96211.1 MAG: hypothetical protein A2350_17415 [Candidatus Raymondbacteria bacterium RifOxyB12_full_50_8]OGJ96920.1 MAG: hypothetical protein A2453_04775 [Candidatus Raymondbacteria bacterium RIFOXYC2_FULL_50_21]OGK04646.1 MAG: hypothetical protein A2519_20940 [Candidatus Raymondbacteria b
MIWEAIPLEDDEIAFYFFSVAGESIAVPYIAAMTRMALRFYLKPDARPGEIIRQTNMALSQTIKTVNYIDGSLGIFDLRTNALRYCTAGSSLLTLTREKTQSAQPLNNAGPAIGIFQDFPVSETTLELFPGDSFRMGLDKYDDQVHIAITGSRRIDAFLNLCSMTGEARVYMKTIHDFDHMSAIIDHLTKETDNIGYSIKYQKRFRLVLLELLTNAIIHGNKYDSAKKVVVLASVTAGYVRVGIVDEGAGYNETDIPNPLLPENLGKPHGRGLLIIKHYASEFSLRGRGNCTVIRLDREREARKI